MQANAGAQNATQKNFTATATPQRHSLKKKNQDAAKLRFETDRKTSLTEKKEGNKYCKDNNNKRHSYS